jgi:phage terminase large subunit
MHYDRKYKRLYIFHEYYGVGISNRILAQHILSENRNNEPVYADSAEPKSINEIRQYGVRISPVKKGPDSVEFGIKFLQDLEEIIIDDVRCPNTAREFLTYELEKDVNGNFKAGFPDKNNHSIDMVRYALNFECTQFRDKQKNKKDPNSYDAKYRRMVDSITGGEVKINL